jgi:DNA polymerase elongation subunit (family B)
MEPKDIITPNRSRVKQNWLIGTFDIETVPNKPGESALIGKFSMGAVCLDAEGKSVRFFPSMLNLLRFMLGYRDNVRWFAHNGANFDFKYFIVEPDCVEWLIANKWTIEVVGGSIPKAMIFKKGHKSILFCDSIKLLNSSLEVLSKDFKTLTSKGKIDFDIEDFNPKNKLHLEYLRDDVISLYQVITKYRDIMVSELNQDIKCTAASTAYSAFRRTLTKNIYHHSKDVNEFCREAYYGARTECFYQGHVKELNWYDINSLYPTMMYEYGGIHRPFGTDRFHEDLPGFYRVLATVPTDFKFGPLPVRRGGLIFPVGDFATIASSEEIKLAREMGATVTIIDGVAFEEHDTELFRPFIQKCIDLRMRDYKGALGTAAKLAQNSLYGFFGMKNERENIIFSEKQPEGDFAPLIDAYSGEELPNIWIGTSIVEASNCIPAFAAWITSNARVKLLRTMLEEEQAGNTVYYCDTDSMFLHPSVEPVCDVGAEYGQWKLEYVVDDFDGISAKAYMAVSKDKVIMKCKGIPSRLLQRDMFYRSLVLSEDIRVDYTQLNSLKAVMGGKGLGRDAHRRFAKKESMSSRTSSEDGFTKAIILNE